MNWVIGLILTFGFILSVGVFIGTTVGESNVQKQAIEAHVAHYVVNEKTSAVRFEFVNCVVFDRETGSIIIEKKLDK